MKNESRYQHKVVRASTHARVRSFARARASPQGMKKAVVPKIKRTAVESAAVATAGDAFAPNAQNEEPRGPRMLERAMTSRTAVLKHMSETNEREIARELMHSHASTATPYSSIGPHPVEYKRRVGAPASEPLERVRRRAILLRPSEDDRRIMRSLKVDRGVDTLGARRALIEMERTRERAESIVTELLETGWEIREVAYMPGDDLGFLKLIEHVGMVVVAIPPALQAQTLLELLRRARSSGVLVMLSAVVGHYLEHATHADISKTLSLPSKRMPAQTLGLVDRCETRDDGYREITLHVLSMPGTSAERNSLRNRILPRLRWHCRNRRVRMHYIDLKDDCPQAGPGQAINSLAHAMKMGGIFVALLSGSHEIDWYASVKLRDYADFMRAEADVSAISDIAWLKHAPNDYSRIEMQLGHVLRVYDDLERKSVVEQTNALIDMSNAERKRIVEAREHAELLRTQHILAYAPKQSVYEKLQKWKDTDSLEFMVSQDPLLQERVGSLVSTLYAHPEVNLTFYNAQLLPPVTVGATENVTKIALPPRTTCLAEFEDTIFGDILSRIEAEFKPDDIQDSIVKAADVEPEISLSERLPFYAHRAMEERVLTKTMKTGQPTVSIVMGFSGGGTTTLLQFCARRARALFSPHSYGAKVDTVTILSDYGSVEGRMNPTPTQIFRNLAAQLKQHLGFEDHIPATLDAARATFMKMLRRATEGRGRVLIFLDALHLVSNPYGIAWLPNEYEVPFGVQFFLGIVRIDRKPTIEKNRLYDNRKMPAVEYTLINSYRHRMYKLQHVALASSCPKAVKNAIKLDVLTFEDRRAYATRFLRPLGIRLTNNMIMQTMDKMCTGDFRGMYLVCSRLAMADPYDADFPAAVSNLPQTTRDHYHQLLASIEKLLPMDVLICALPVITCGAGIITCEDVARILHDYVLPAMPFAVIMDTCVMNLLWAARFIIKGSSFGGYAVTPTDSLVVDDQVVHDVIMERYASKEASKRLIYQMLAQHFGKRVTGRELLGRVLALKIKADAGFDVFARDINGEYVNIDLKHEHHMTMRSIEYLPYFLTQARMFDVLVELLTDVDFMQAKLMIGEGQALIDDLDRILPTSYGPERPLWISAQLSSNEEVVDVPGAPSGIDGKLRQLAIYNSHCLGFHVEAYQYYATQSVSNKMTEELASIRDVLWRNIETLHQSPQMVRQILNNDVGEGAPRRFSSNGLIEASESAIRDATGAERLAMRWENRPREGLGNIAFRSAFERGAEVKCIMWLDDATFVVGYFSGGVEIWSAPMGEIVARFIGHERAVTALTLLNHDNIKNARTSVYVVSGSKDKTIRVWRLDDSLGRECATLTGHADGITSLAFAPTTNELISAAGKEIRCWSCAPGYPLQYTLNTDHTAPVSSIALASDLSFMITASLDGIMRLWLFTMKDAATRSSGGGTKYQRDYGIDDATSGFASMDATSFGGASSNSGSNRGFKSKSLTSAPPAVTLELRGHLGDITCTACTQNGDMLASGGIDQSIMMWEPKKGKHIGMIRSHEGTISALKFSSDERLLISASLDRTCKVFNVSNGALLLSLSHCSRVTYVDISSDASALITGTIDGSIRLWNWLGREGSTSNGNVPRRTNLFRKTYDKVDAKTDEPSTSVIHQGKVLASCHLDVEGVGSCFVTGGEDGAVRVLNAKDWKLVEDIQPLQSAKIDKTPIQHIAFTAMCAVQSESSVYFGKADGALTGWDFITNAWTWPNDHEVSEHKSAITSMAPLSESMLVTADATGAVCIWNVGRRSPALAKTLVGHSARVHGVCVESHTSFYSVGADRVVKHWNVDRGTFTDFTAHDLAVTGCAISERGLVTVGADNFIKLWDARAGVETSRTYFLAGTPLTCETIAEQPNWVTVLGDAGLHVYDVRKSNKVLSFSSPYGFSRRAEAILSTCAFNREATRSIVADTFGRVHGCSTALISSHIEHDY